MGETVSSEATTPPTKSDSTFTVLLPGLCVLSLGFCSIVLALATTWYLTKDFTWVVVLSGIVIGIILVMSGVIICGGSMLAHKALPVLDEANASLREANASVEKTIASLDEVHESIQKNHAAVAENLRAAETRLDENPSAEDAPLDRGRYH